MAHTANELIEARRKRQEDEILGGILRRFLADDDNYVGTNGLPSDADLTLDGHVALTPIEGATVWAVLGRG